MTYALVTSPIWCVMSRLVLQPVISTLSSALTGMVAVPSGAEVDVAVALPVGVSVCAAAVGVRTTGVNVDAFPPVGVRMRGVGVAGQMTGVREGVM